MKSEIKSHWENVYKTKNSNQVSWTQEIPKISLDFIHSFGLDKTVKIIDIGGGDSKLVDYLILEGYKNITVLDISENAIEKAKKRLGNNAQKTTWIVCDITTFEPDTTYDIWHDRATFHFLIEPEQISKYKNLTEKVVTKYLIIGTFSENGPKKCSGLYIKQYNEESLTATFKKGFDNIKCITENHTTPFDTIQHFIFCCLKK